MKNILITVGFCWFLLVGCGSVSQSTSPSNNHIETGPVYLGIVWNHHIYAENEVVISTVGKQLGKVTQVDKGKLNQSNSGTISNTDKFPVGSKIYAVPGKSVLQVIAIQEVDGKYVQIESLPHK